MSEPIDARLQVLAQRRAHIIAALPGTERAVMALRDLVDSGLPGYTEPHGEPFTIPDDTPPGLRADLLAWEEHHQLAAPAVGRGPLQTRLRTRRGTVRRTAPRPAMTRAADQAREGHDGEARVLVNVLGHFDVWHGDRDLTPPRGRASELVQLLALHDGVMHRDTIAAALWPDDPPWTGRQLLRNVLWRVRTHTGDLITRDPYRDLIRFANPVRIDLTEFLRLSAHAIRHADRDPQQAITAGTQALMLHRGPLLQDNPYAEWAQDARHHVGERHRLLHEALAEASEQLGDLLGARLYR